MNKFFKHVLLPSFTFFYTQYPLQASEDIDRNSAYKLEIIHKVNFDKSAIQKRVKELTEQQFPEKRAKEIFAQDYVRNFFKTSYKQELLPASALVLGMKGTYQVELYKKNEGVLDEVFTIPDIQKLENSNTLIIFNETHFLEENHSVQPSDFKELDPQYVFTSSYSPFSGLKGILRKPCGIINVSLPLLKCGPLITLYLRGNLKRRLDEYRIDHTLTTLTPDDTLTLFKVTKRA